MSITNSYHAGLVALWDVRSVPRVLSPTGGQHRKRERIMGADLVVAVVPICKTKAEALAKLHAYDKTDLTMELEFLLSADADSPDEQIVEAVELAARALDIVYDYVEYGSRETAVVRFGSRRLLVTGGMTWGDDPTDAYQPMAIVENLQLTWDDGDL